MSAPSSKEPGVKTFREILRNCLPQQAFSCAAWCCVYLDISERLRGLGSDTPIGAGASNLGNPGAWGTSNFRTQRQPMPTPLPSCNK